MVGEKDGLAERGTRRGWGSGDPGRELRGYFCTGWLQS